MKYISVKFCDVQNSLTNVHGDHFFYLTSCIEKECALCFWLILTV